MVDFQASQVFYPVASHIVTHPNPHALYSSWTSVSLISSLRHPPLRHCLILNGGTWCSSLVAVSIYMHIHELSDLALSQSTRIFVALLCQIRKSWAGEAIGTKNIARGGSRFMTKQWTHVFAYYSPCQGASIGDCWLISVWPRMHEPQL